MTLAQVFWLRDEQRGQPQRMFVVADGALSVGEHFAGFGGDLAVLRKRLRGTGAELHEHFTDYGKAFRRRLGIESEQATELFGQTVSMKAVDNLNDFVRQHMLEPFDVASRVRELVAHFDDLTRTHEAVVRARAQLDLLAPLTAELDAHERLRAEHAALDAQRRALPYFLAERRRSLLQIELREIDATSGRPRDAGGRDTHGGRPVPRG